MTSPPDFKDLHERFATRAAEYELLDISYRVIDSPLGSLLLAATPQGVVRVGFESEDHDRVLTDLAHRISPRILHTPHLFDPVARQFDEYFAGTRRHFQVDLDTQLTTQFRRLVLQFLFTDIGYGQTATYAGVAHAVNNPHAVRAVGTACATNPLPLLVPCHRVIRTDGSFGDYRGGKAAKQYLLQWETTHSL